MAAIWDGITKTESILDVQLRHTLADVSRDYNWPRMLELLSEHEMLVNATRPSGPSLYTPLHQAAHGGAPMDVIDRLIELGAWRTLRNARGERPVDIARKQGHQPLLPKLKPQYQRHVLVGVLLTIQAHFHEVIRERAGKLVDQNQLRLPVLEPLLELDRPEMWFPVPGMYGGFSFRLERVGVEAELVSESWCRIVDGSGQKHVVTSKGSTLVEEGFV